MNNKELKAFENEILNHISSKSEKIDIDLFATLFLMVANDEQKAQVLEMVKKHLEEL